VACSPVSEAGEAMAPPTTVEIVDQGGIGLAQMQAHLIGRDHFHLGYEFHHEAVLAGAIREIFEVRPDRFGVEGGAVGEGNAFAQREGEDGIVLVIGPVGGEAGHDRAIGLHDQQRIGTGCQNCIWLAIISWARSKLLLSSSAARARVSSSFATCAMAVDIRAKEVMAAPIAARKSLGIEFLHPRFPRDCRIFRRAALASSGWIATEMQRHALPIRVFDRSHGRPMRRAYRYGDF
jgi:hypothetical protein